MQIPQDASVTVGEYLYDGCCVHVTETVFEMEKKTRNIIVDM